MHNNDPTNSGRPSEKPVPIVMDAVTERRAFEAHMDGLFADDGAYARCDAAVKQLKHLVSPYIGKTYPHYDIDHEGLKELTIGAGGGLAGEWGNGPETAALYNFGKFSQKSASIPLATRAELFFSMFDKPTELSQSSPLLKDIYHEYLANGGVEEHTKRQALERCGNEIEKWLDFNVKNGVLTSPEEVQTIRDALTEYRSSLSALLVEVDEGKRQLKGLQARERGGIN